MRPAEVPVDATEAEEYAVLSALIRQEYVADGTRTVFILDRSFPLFPQFIRQAPDLVPGISPEMVSDFEARNADRHGLRLLLDLPVRYVLVPAPEIQVWSGEVTRPCDTIYGPPVVLRRLPDCPRDFLRVWSPRYSDPPGLLFMSLPGFSPSNDHAVVYIRRLRHGSTSQNLYNMEKVNGLWRVAGAAQVYFDY